MSTSKATKTIFLAEDEPAIAEVIQFLLVDAGYEVIYAKDGNEALDLLDKYVPDLFLLDVMMPGRDGFAVAREIRARPVLDGAEQYIVKPFDNNDLLRRIEEIVN